MQERYLGDSHDFVKYALLRHLSHELGGRLGVNWYLTKPEDVDRPDNNDGGKRHHMKGGVWRASDPDLFDAITKFDDPSHRTLSNLAASGILPAGTVYHSEPVPSTARPEWHRRALSNLSSSELVFIDPDNGFEVASQTRRTAPKYANFREAADFVEAGKTIVAIQFARQCDPIQRAYDVRARLLSELAGHKVLPVIRGRLAPNILFVTVSPEDRHERTLAALEAFPGKCAKAELIA